MAMRVSPEYPVVGRLPDVAGTGWRGSPTPTDAVVLMLRRALPAPSLVLLGGTWLTALAAGVSFPAKARAASPGPGLPARRLRRAGGEEVAPGPVPRYGRPRVPRLPICRRWWRGARAGGPYWRDGRPGGLSPDLLPGSGAVCARPPPPGLGWDGTAHALALWASPELPGPVGGDGRRLGTARRATVVSALLFRGSAGSRLNRNVRQ